MRYVFNILLDVFVLGVECCVWVLESLEGIIE